MEQKNRLWIDIAIIISMVVFVFLLCQPMRRNWDEYTKEMYTGEEGVYATDTDTYYYLRVAKQFSEGGLSSIRLFYGKLEDGLRTPLRAGEADKNPQLLSALAAGIWYILNLFGIKVGIFSVAIRLCSFILALCTIPIYLFLKRRVSRSSSVFGALVVALAPPYMRHSFRGFFDTDALIGLLAIILVLSVYECFLRESRKEVIRFGILSCLAAVLLFFSWITFYVYVVIAVGTSVFGLFMTRLIMGKRNPKEKDGLLLPRIIFVILILSFTIAVGGKSFIKTVGDVLRPTVDSEPWPSAAMLVSELERKPFISRRGIWYWFMAVDSDYMSYFGGGILFLFLIFSVLFLSIRNIARLRDKEMRKKGETFLFFAIGGWLLGTLILASFGIRFTEFVISPSGIIMAFALSSMEIKLKEKIENVVLKRAIYCGLAFLAFCVLVGWLPLVAVLLAGGILLFGFFASRRKTAYVLNGLILVVLLSAIICDAWLVSSRATPYVEKPTEEALKWISENTKEDAVLADFWGLGYIFQYYSGRRTLADGGTYNGVVNYWLATMMTTDDLNLSIGIARMLQQGGIDGTEYAALLFNGNAKAAERLKVILPLSREQASEYLRQTCKLSPEEGEKLLSYTHPKSCPDLYFIAENNLMVRAASLSVYSDWDFSGEVSAPRSTVLGQYSVQIPSKGEEVFCDLWKAGIADGWKIGLYNDGEKINGRLISPEGEESQFHRTVYSKDGEWLYDDCKEDVVYSLAEAHGQALIILEENHRLSVVVCDERQLESTLFKLYLFDGKGQDLFEKVYESELPENVSGDVSKIQRKIGTGRTRNYINCGITVWKVKNGLYSE